MPDDSLDDVSALVRSKIEGTSSSEREYAEELQAYRDIRSMIRDAKDQFTKRVHEQTLDFAIHSPMKFSYVVENVMLVALKEQREARRSLRPYALYEAIERISSGGTNTQGFGQSTRWPLQTHSTYSNSQKIKRSSESLEKTVLPANFRNSSYQFGVHNYPVGMIIGNIINMIEDRYGIDFVELERSRQKPKSKT